MKSWVTMAKDQTGRVQKGASGVITLAVIVIVVVAVWIGSISLKQIEKK